MTTYTASSYIWLGDYVRAQHQAERAISAHEATPIGSRSLSREAIAQLDLGIAPAFLGSPVDAAALDALMGRPVGDQSADLIEAPLRSLPQHWDRSHLLRGHARPDQPARPS